MTAEAADGPAKTEESIREDLERLGAARGMTLLVHSSLSAIGWVAGGPAAVVRALLDVVGADGTLVMPAATPQCAGLPVFDSRTTPTSMGAIPETFRTWPGTVRSDHPLESVCARGPLAPEITSSHPLAFSEGPGGPFGKLHELESRVLLLGVGFNRCTALHFAESLAERRRLTTVRFPLLDQGRPVWHEHPNVADDNDAHFPIIGQRYLSTGRPKRGAVGDAPATLFPMRDLVELAGEYFREVL